MAKSIKAVTRPASELASPPPRESAAPAAQNKPVHSIRYGNIKATIWQNPSETNGPFHTVSVTRSWRDDKDQWHDSQSFNFKDLPSLAKAITDAHSWIAWTERRQGESQSTRQ